ncbi:hypothetical protein PO124_11385 [Bacillus licheniformis]|nr:hypothetical protein [Bacillus licheniformis]
MSGFSVSAHRGALDEARGYMNTYIVSSLVLSVILFFRSAARCFYRSDHSRSRRSLGMCRSRFDRQPAVLLTFVMSGFAAGPFSPINLYYEHDPSHPNADSRSERIVDFAWFAPKIWHIQLAALIATASACILSIFSLRD